jgi:AcrR family transcriptional regulator
MPTAPTNREVPPRPRGRVRRPQILAATTQLLRERGLWSVRVADVAERAGTSPAGVIYYFGTKHELFRAAIDDTDRAFYSGLARELDTLPTALERLASLIVRSSRSEWILWIDLWAYARRHPELLSAQRAFNDRWWQTIAEVVRFGRDAGEFPATAADPNAIAVRLAALTSGLAVHVVLGNPGRTPEHYVEMALAAASAELGCDPGALSEAARRVPAR